METFILNGGYKMSQRLQKGGVAVGALKEKVRRFEIEELFINAERKL
jgi:hypothetical protein